MKLFSCCLIGGSLLVNTSCLLVFLSISAIACPSLPLMCLRLHPCSRHLFLGLSTMEIPCRFQSWLMLQVLDAGWDVVNCVIMISYSKTSSIAKLVKPGRMQVPVHRTLFAKIIPDNFPHFFLRRLQKKCGFSEIFFSNSLQCPFASNFYRQCKNYKGRRRRFWFVSLKNFFWIMTHNIQSSLFKNSRSRGDGEQPHGRHHLHRGLRQ